MADIVIENRIELINRYSECKGEFIAHSFLSRGDLKMPTYQTPSSTYSIFNYSITRKREKLNYKIIAIYRQQAIQELKSLISEVSEASFYCEK